MKPESSVIDNTKKGVSNALDKGKKKYIEDLYGERLKSLKSIQEKERGKQKGKEKLVR